MESKFARTKKFVRDNKVEIAFCAGATVAITTVYFVLKAKGVPSDITTRLFVDNDHLQKLIASPDLALRFDMSPKERIFIINGPMPVKP